MRCSDIGEVVTLEDEVCGDSSTSSTVFGFISQIRYIWVRLPCDDFDHECN